MNSFIVGKNNNHEIWHQCPQCKDYFDARIHGWQCPTCFHQIIFYFVNILINNK